MALLAFEGFEGAGTTTGTSAITAVREYIKRRYIVESNTFREDSGNAPHLQTGYGGVGFALSWGQSTAADSNYFLVPLGKQLTQAIVGFAIKPRADIDNESIIMSFWNTAESEAQVDLRVIQNRGLFCYTDTFNTINGSWVAEALAPDEWAYVEIRMVMSNTVGQLEIYVNGIQKINLTSIDTQGDSGATFFDAIRFYGIDGNGTTVADQCLIDDIYVVDTSGSQNNTFLGPVKVEALFPDGEGATINFTPSVGTNNAANVDENPINDDTDYNSSSDTASNKDLLTCANLSTLTGNIKGVKVISAARSVSGLPVGLQSIVAEGTPTQGTGSVVEVSSDAKYSKVEHIFEQNPDTIAAWAVAEVNGMSIGYEID